MPAATDASGPVRPAPSSEFQIDRAVATLAGNAGAWASLPLPDRIAHLRVLLRRTGEVGPGLVEAALAAKGADRSFAGEDWVGGVAIQARGLRVLLDTLESIEATGRVPIGASDVSARPDGQVVVRVTPMDAWDRLLFPGWRGEVWLDPAVSLDGFDDHVGSFYTKGGTARPGVAAVLGAGNVASIGPLDVVHKMFVDGKVAALKFNPVNDYLGRFFERVFADLIDDGYVRPLYGGAAEGMHLVHHPLVDEVHLTGSAATHDAIVFGTGPDGAARKAKGERILAKPITSELGNVSPVIVVPGEWRERDLRFQAEHLATQMKQNDGFNCNAAKVLVLSEAWEQKDAFLGHLRTVLGGLAPRPAYYPGAVERWEAFAASHPEVEFIGPVGHGLVPATLLQGIDPAAPHRAFSEEAFCAVTAVTELAAPGPAGFLEAAVEFCNERLTGTLNATILADPATTAALGGAVEDAVAVLRYGAIGVNIWGGASYALGTTTWGGFPGHEVTDVQSGIGFVHNGRLIDRPQKSVVWAPFRMFPKPPWFITHRSTVRAMRWFSEFEVDPSPGRVLKVAAAALRG